MAKILVDRDKRILDAAIAAAEEHGYQWITREDVAARVGCSVGSVSKAFGPMIELKRAVLRAAVERGLASIVSQGLADRHPIATAAPAHLKKEAVALQLAG